MLESLAYQPICSVAELSSTGVHHRHGLIRVHRLAALQEALIPSQMMYRMLRSGAAQMRDRCSDEWHSRAFEIEPSLETSVDVIAITAVA